MGTSTYPHVPFPLLMCPLHEATLPSVPAFGKLHPSPLTMGVGPHLSHVDNLMLPGLPKYPLFVAWHKKGLGENLLPQQIHRYSFLAALLSGTFTLDLNLGVGFMACVV